MFEEYEVHRGGQGDDEGHHERGVGAQSPQGLKSLEEKDEESLGNAEEGEGMAGCIHREHVVDIDYEANMVLGEDEGQRVRHVPALFAQVPI